jgi:hypothetical protein
MTRRARKGAPPAATALSVPGIRVVVAEPDQEPPPAGTAAKTPASAGRTQHRKRRAKFVF